MSKEIQITETGLRKLYNTLKVKNTEEQKEVAKCYYDNTDKLIKLYNEAIESFGDFDFCGDFVNDGYERKEIKKPQEEKGTRKVIAYFKESNNKNKIFITNESSLNFDYINREISPHRSPKSGNKSSGLGGIDFIGWNTPKKGPIIGEIKVGSDGNPFLALIQALTYSSEMFTPNQIKRINTFKLFGENNINLDNNNIYIYLLFFEFPGNGKTKSKKNELLEYALYIAGNIKNKIKDIKDIPFLFMKEKKENSSNGYEIYYIKDFEDFEKLKKI